MTFKPFYMLQMRFDARGLATLGRMLQLPLKRTGRDYLVHCALGELFGDLAPKPFSIETSEQMSRSIEIIAYSDVDADKLQQAAQTYASPQIYGICNWQSFASKQMPAPFEAQTRLGFELTTCPIKRMASDGERWRENAEIDVFLLESWQQGEEAKIDHEQVYQKWLKSYFEDHLGGATIDHVALTNFRLHRFLRRTNQEREAKTVKGPVATFQGELTVTEPDAFYKILRTGIGRHKTFGYGMIKLRRPGRL